MSIGPNRFNIYLLVLCAGLTGGCASTKTPAEKRQEKLAATLRVHVQVPPGSEEFSSEASVFRENPVTIIVARTPFVTESEVAQARVIDSQGGFLLQIQFDQHGTLLLEQFTTSNPGKHFAVFCEFGDKLQEHRWLAAPIIPKRISNGLLTFTPDASREETELIAKGLNNVGKKLQEKLAW